ncbi:MAG: hypothetical protein MI923_25850 [Phycisphaerales bacterium]|nr:hypothetical protein [Phycisphaerales bacterium]
MVGRRREQAVTVVFDWQRLPKPTHCQQRGESELPPLGGIRDASVGWTSREDFLTARSGIDRARCGTRSRMSPSRRLRESEPGERLSLASLRAPLKRLAAGWWSGGWWLWRGSDLSGCRES